MRIGLVVLFITMFSSGAFAQYGSAGSGGERSGPASLDGKSGNIQSPNLVIDTINAVPARSRLQISARCRVTRRTSFRILRRELMSTREPRS